MHKSGAAVWEVWLAAPAQPMDAARWTAWLDMEAPASLARRIWGCLSAGGGAAAHTPEMTLPLMVLRWPDGQPGRTAGGACARTRQAAAPRHLAAALQAALRGRRTGGRLLPPRARPVAAGPPRRAGRACARPARR
ncbi:MAG: hypothetical protein MZU91_12490 [Desulfosudis oleivorans]|nr:hypothetical protein [Desulfosudis oleivorans]